MTSYSSISCSVILHVPECDLPQRMLPDDNSSNSFIVSAHHGNENIKKRWIEDRAVKVAGYPIRAVRQCTARKEQAESWELTLLSMNRMLVGQVLPTHIYLEADDVSEEMCVAADDLEALWCYFADPGELVLPVNTADIQLHCLVPPERPHVTAQCPPPMFISSVTVPAYVRLHLLSVLLNAITSGEVTESGTGFLVEAMGVLDAEWALLEENGPPDISAVLQHLLPPPPTATKSSDGPKTAKPLGVKGQRRGRGGDRDPRTDTEVQRDFEKICKSDKYVQLLTTRQRLPSFASKDQFLSMLDRSRVVVVVGETGCGKTTQRAPYSLNPLSPC
jgi:ATP-dependent RNA helicase DHX57